MKYHLSLLIFVLVALFAVNSASAHPGGKDANGGHHCWTRCDYWGYRYGGYHYHDGGIPLPPPPPSYVCEYNGKKYYSHQAAEKAWYADIDAEVKEIYETFFERDATSEDYTFWHAQFPYNKCDGEWNNQKIWDWVKDSNEAKERIARLEAEVQRIRAEAQLRNTPNPTIEPVPPEKDSVSWWWSLFLLLPVVWIYEWWTGR